MDELEGQLATQLASQPEKHSPADGSLYASSGGGNGTMDPASSSAVGPRLKARLQLQKPTESGGRGRRRQSAGAISADIIGKLGSLDPLHGALGEVADSFSKQVGRPTAHTSARGRPDLLALAARPSADRIGFPSIHTAPDRPRRATRPQRGKVIEEEPPQQVHLVTYVTYVTYVSRRSRHSRCTW